MKTLIVILIAMSFSVGSFASVRLERPPQEIKSRLENAVHLSTIFQLALEQAFQQVGISDGTSCHYRTVKAKGQQVNSPKSGNVVEGEIKMVTVCAGAKTPQKDQRVIIIEIEGQVVQSQLQVRQLKINLTGMKE